MTHFLDESPFDASRKESQELRKILMTCYRTPALATMTAEMAGVSLENVRDTPIAVVWSDLLYNGAIQGKNRRLVEVVRDDRNVGAYRAQFEAMLVGAPPAPPPWHNSPAVDREVLLGARSTLVPIAFLEEGLAKARSVAHVKVIHMGSSAYGTCFLIGPKLVLTNHHVLFKSTDPTPPREVEIRFDYEDGVDGKPKSIMVATGDVTKIHGDSARDWAVIELTEPVPADHEPLSVFPRVPLSKDEKVYIIQHPLGKQKQIGLDRNIVTYVDGDVIQYLSDTEAGSSGSPVFNERWEVVGLHRGATPKGALEVRNVGIRIERVADGLRAKGLLTPATRGD